MGLISKPMLEVYAYIKYTPYPFYMLYLGPRPIVIMEWRAFIIMGKIYSLWLTVNINYDNCDHAFC